MNNPLQSHEVQRALRRRVVSASRRGVKPEPAFDDAWHQTALAEDFVPLRWRKIVVGKNDAMGSVSGEIHDAKRRSCQPAANEMVLDENTMARDTNGLFEHRGRRFRVVQHVGKHHGVECVIGKRQMRSIEWNDLDMRLLTHQNVDARYRGIRAMLQDQAVDQAVSASHVQDRMALRQKIRKMRRQDPHSTRVNDASVHSSQKGERRRHV